jgi:hypothetical protein
MRFLAVVAIMLAVTGCATMTRGTTQVVAINTPGVPGATCTLSSSSIGTQTAVTPGTVTLQKGRDNVSVHCSKECYQDGAGVIASNMEGMTAGNILLGGVIGIGVDAASGAMNSYTPGDHDADSGLPAGRSGAPLTRVREVGDCLTAFNGFSLPSVT